jgi:hypothetical protein
LAALLRIWVLASCALLAAGGCHAESLASGDATASKDDGNARNFDWTRPLPEEIAPNPASPSGPRPYLRDVGPWSSQVQWTVGEVPTSWSAGQPDRPVISNWSKPRPEEISPNPTAPAGTRPYLRSLGSGVAARQGDVRNYTGAAFEGSNKRTLAPVAGGGTGTPGSGNVGDARKSDPRQVQAAPRPGGPPAMAGAPRSAPGAGSAASGGPARSAQGTPAAAGVPSSLPGSTVEANEAPTAVNPSASTSRAGSPRVGSAAANKVSDQAAPDATASNGSNEAVKGQTAGGISSAGSADRRRSGQAALIGTAPSGRAAGDGVGTAAQKSVGSENGAGQSPGSLADAPAATDPPAAAGVSPPAGASGLARNAERLAISERQSNDGGLARPGAVAAPSANPAPGGGRTEPTASGSTAESGSARKNQRTAALSSAPGRAELGNLDGAVRGEATSPRNGDPSGHASVASDSPRKDARPAVSASTYDTGPGPRSDATGNASRSAGRVALGDAPPALRGNFSQAWSTAAQTNIANAGAGRAESTGTRGDGPINASSAGQPAGSGDRPQAGAGAAGRETTIGANKSGSSPTASAAPESSGVTPGAPPAPATGTRAGGPATNTVSVAGATNAGTRVNRRPPRPEQHRREIEAGLLASPQASHRAAPSAPRRPRRHRPRAPARRLQAVRALRVPIRRLRVPAVRSPWERHRRRQELRPHSDRRRRRQRPPGRRVQPHDHPRTGFVVRERKPALFRSEGSR